MTKVTREKTSGHKFQRGNAASTARPLTVQPAGRTDVVQATLRAGASFLSVIREICASNVFLDYLLGASAGLLGLWLSMPIAGPPRNVLDHSLGYFHVLDHCSKDDRQNLKSGLLLIKCLESWFSITEASVLAGTQKMWTMGAPCWKGEARNLGPQVQSQGSSGAFGASARWLFFLYKSSESLSGKEDGF